MPRSIDELLAELPPAARANAEARVRQAILDEARAAFLDAAAEYCFEMRHAPPSIGALGTMRRAYDAMLLAWRDSPEAERERARLDAKLNELEEE